MKSYHLSADFRENWKEELFDRRWEQNQSRVTTTIGKEMSEMFLKDVKKLKKFLGIK